MMCFHHVLCKQAGCLKETREFCVSRRRDSRCAFNVMQFSRKLYLRIEPLTWRRKNDRVFTQIQSQRLRIFFTKLIMHSIRIVLKTNNSLNLKITTIEEHTTFPLFFDCFANKNENKVKHRICHAEKERIKQKLASVVQLRPCLLFLFYFIRTNFCELWSDTSKFSLDFAHRHIHSLFYDANIWLMCFILLFKCIAYLL